MLSLCLHDSMSEQSKLNKGIAPLLIDVSETLEAPCELFTSGSVGS